MRYMDKIPADNIKYIAVDLDGTLLGKKSRLSSETKKTIEKVQKLGKKIIICTGRAIDRSLEIARELKLDKYGGYVISFNGGLIYEIGEGYLNKLEITDDVYICEDTKKKITEVLSTYKGKLMSYSENEVSFRNHSISNYLYAKVVHLKLTKEEIPTPIKMILVYKEYYIKAVFDTVKAELEAVAPHINVFTSYARAIEMTAPNSNKGDGLTALMKYLNSNVEELMVFGDEGNDLTMFQMAKYSIAMENAIPALKNIAFDTTTSHIDNGVANYLNILFRL